MIVRDHFLHDVRTRADDHAGIKIACIDIDDAAVGIAQIVHKRRVRFAGGDGECLTVRLHIRDFGVAGRAVMVFQQMFQALLDRFCVHRVAAGERDVKHL